MEDRPFFKKPSGLDAGRWEDCDLQSRRSAKKEKKKKKKKKGLHPTQISRSRNMVK